MVRTIDFILYSISFFVLCFAVVGFEWANAAPLVILSFIVNGIWTLYHCVFHTINISIKRTVYIFSLFFLVIAPLSQYLSNTVLWQGNGLHVTYSDSEYIYANIMIFLFFILFEIGYRGGKKSWIRNDGKYEVRRERTLQILTFICTICFIIIFITNGLMKLDSSSALNIQVRNMIFFAPVECFLACMEAFKKNKSYKIYMTICAFETAIVYVLFSASMSRFMFLGVLVAILVSIIYNIKDKSVYFLIYVLGFSLMFTSSRGQGLFGWAIGDVNFNHVDYDAYQIFLLVIKYVEANGISWGANILSAICCVLPRAYFPWRLDPTGAIVVSNYGSWFENVSCPLPAELYFAFGIVGILIGGYIIGLIVKKTELLMSNESEFAHGVFCIIVGMTVYIMRGSLLSTFAYLVGILLAYFLIFKLIYVKI